MRWEGAPPRFATTPTEGRQSIGPEVVSIAEMLGFELLPWQRYVAQVGGELIVDEAGRLVPAYPEVGVTVPRQSGKTTLYLVWILHRLFHWEAFDGRPASVAYTMQDGASARKKFKEDMWPMVERSAYGKLFGRARFAAENTGVMTKRGGNWSVWSSSPSAGHGQTIDLGVMDELFKDTDGRRDQAMRPAMATRHDAQKLWCSTAGDESALILSRKVAAGREAVRSQADSGVAYFEWSADPDSDPESPATWAACHPALGYTVSPRTVKAALDESRVIDPTLGDFKRAWLNIGKADVAVSGVIPAELWSAVCSHRVRAGAHVVLAVDANRDGTGAAIAACDAAGNVEIAEHRRGPTEWLLERVAAIAAKHRARVVVDVGGPVGYLADRLRTEFDAVSVDEMTTRDVCHAAQDFRAAVADRKIRVRTNDGLDAAVESAAIRPVGESWTWSRATVVDASPLLAATIAYAAATQTATLQPFAIA